MKWGVSDSRCHLVMVIKTGHSAALEVLQWGVWLAHQGLNLLQSGDLFSVKLVSEIMATVCDSNTLLFLPQEFALQSNYIPDYLGPKYRS